MVEPGLTYEITAWVRLDALSTASHESVRLTTRATCNAQGEDYRALAQISLSTDWASLTGELSVDYRRELESIRVFLEGPAPDVAFCADDASLRVLP